MRKELKEMFFQAEDYLADGQYSLAVKTYREALKTAQDKGEEFLALTYIGAVYDDKGDQRSAISTFRDCQQLAEKSFGRSSLYYAVALSNEAMQYSNRGKPDRAEPLLDEAIRICRSTDVLQEVKKTDFLATGVVEIYSNAGECKARRGKVAEALDLMQDAYNVAKSTLDGRNSRRLQASLELGALLAALGRKNEADAITQEVMSNAKKAMGHPAEVVRAFEQAVANAAAFLEGIEQAQIDALKMKHRNSNVVPILPNQHESQEDLPCAGYQLKISLRGITPPLWRRVIVPADCSLGELHEIIQAAMGWSDDHLHEFRIGRSRFGDKKQISDANDERKFKLAQFGLSAGSKIEYEYDFGDSWIHSIVVEKTVNAVVLAESPTFVTGRGACPPEDCGGSYGFMAFLEARQAGRKLPQWWADFDYDTDELPSCFPEKKKTLVNKTKSKAISTK